MKEKIVAKQTIQLQPFLQSAMRCVPWDRIDKQGLSEGRPRITVCLDIIHELPQLQETLKGASDLLLRIESLTELAVRLEAQSPRSKAYFSSCVLLSILISAYLEMENQHNNAFEAIRDIGIRKHCNAVLTLLDGECIE